MRNEHIKASYLIRNCKLTTSSTIIQIHCRWFKNATRPTATSWKHNETNYEKINPYDKAPLWKFKIALEIHKGYTSNNESQKPVVYQRPITNKHGHTQYNSFSDSFILPPFLCPHSLLLSLLVAVGGVSGEGEGQPAMIMQQAAVLHPDATRHTQLFSSFLAVVPMPIYTEHTRRTTHSCSTPKPKICPNSWNFKNMSNHNHTWAPGLTLHYEVCEPVFLPLSPHSPLACSFFSLSCQPALGWLDPSCHPRPDLPPTNIHQSQAAPLRASQPALTSLA